ncbi:MAG: hypothetical protein HY744_26960 [Deltaproteobacteria bacterium]|nr:hypothetical protein [Deltaproteobacteria bacterium]
MPRPAAADLKRDAETLLEAWNGSGAKAARLGTLFLHEGQRQRLPLPARRAGSACAAVVALAERQLWFTLGPHAGVAAAPAGQEQFGEEPSLDRGEPGGAPVRSQAGVARLSDCGRGCAPLLGVELAMGSGRGAIEVLMVSGADLLMPVELVLPERARGAPAPVDEAGPLPVPGPLVERLQRAERAARADGAVDVTPLDAGLFPSGGGGLLLKLAAGCHRLAVLAEGPPEARARGIDMDAELRLPGERAPLVRDRSHAPDARIDFCLGDAGPVELRFAGPSGPVEITVVDASWPLPPGLPRQGGAQLRAELAWALHRSRSTGPQSPPTFMAAGASGVTLVPVDVEPGACYLAALGLSRGEARAMRLAARVAGRSYHDETTEPPFGAALSFCAGSARLALLSAEVRAAGAWWTLVLWPHGREEP